MLLSNVHANLLTSWTTQLVHSRSNPSLRRWRSTWRFFTWKTMASRCPFPNAPRSSVPFTVRSALTMNHPQGYHSLKLDQVQRSWSKVSETHQKWFNCMSKVCMPKDINYTYYIRYYMFLTCMWLQCWSISTGQAYHLCRQVMVHDLKKKRGQTPSNMSCRCWRIRLWRPFSKPSASGVKRMMSTLENGDSSVEFQVSHIALHHRGVWRSRRSVHRWSSAWQNVE